MIFSIFRTIALGIMAGFALFVLPFILMKVLIFALFVGIGMRLMRGRSRRHMWQQMPYRPAYVDNLREDAAYGQWARPATPTHRPTSGQIIVID